MEGIYVVETMFDYCTQLYAFATEKEAEMRAKELTKEIGRECWVEYYKFGEEFCGD